MPQDAAQPIRMTRTLIGPEVSVGGRTIRSVARLTAQVRQSGGERSGQGGSAAAVWAWGQIQPVEAIVREPGRSERHIAIEDLTMTLVARMAAIAALIAALSLALGFLARVTRTRGATSQG